MYNSSDPRMKGLKGEFQAIGNGVFLITLRNPVHTATQILGFPKGRKCGGEGDPGRGEKQTAVLVADDGV